MCGWNNHFPTYLLLVSISRFPTWLTREQVFPVMLTTCLRTPTRAMPTVTSFLRALPGSCRGLSNANNNNKQMKKQCQMRILDPWGIFFLQSPWNLDSFSEGQSQNWFGFKFLAFKSILNSWSLSLGIPRSQLLSIKKNLLFSAGSIVSSLSS